jgi:hypothetical protein
MPATSITPAYRITNAAMKARMRRRVLLMKGV